MNELFAQRGVDELRSGLARPEPVVYGENGNRATDGRRLLRDLERLMPAIGVTRLADISCLVPNRFPVYQSTRPRLWVHHSHGQNSGSQGKGTSRRQARLSCLVESVESFCAEPRNPRLVRGSYRRLRSQHAVLPPAACLAADGQPAPSADEPLMWTPAYHVGLDTEMLVPAEAIYFPFLPASYATRSLFPCSSNGAGGGATYLEATIHGLYEVIERMYIGLAERRALAVEALFESDVTSFDIARFHRDEELELQLHAFEMRGVRNIPMIACLLVGHDSVCYGWGCCAELDTAVSRAISEALQSYAIAVSGSREDLDDRGPTSRRHLSAFAQPEVRTLHLSALRRRIHDHAFRDLRDELAFLLEWLAGIGFPHVCVANLTRAGVDIPVVKVLVPGLPAKQQVMAAIAGPRLTVERSLGREYSFEGEAA